MGGKPQDNYKVSNETKSLRPGTLSFGEEIIGLCHKEVGTNSLRSGFTMELFLERVYPETIMIIGTWYSNAFLWYIRIQVSDISSGISDLMVSPRAFYTIPGAEVIYYAPGQLGVQSHRLNPQQGITNTTTSSLLLLRLNVIQGRNTHNTSSEIYDQKRGKMV